MNVCTKSHGISICWSVSLWTKWGTNWQTYIVIYCVINTLTEFSSVIFDNILFCDNLGQLAHTHRCVGISFSWVFSHMRPPTERTFIKEVFLLRIYSYKGGSSIIMAAQRSIITPELSLLSLVTLQCSNGYYKEELWWPRQRDILQPSITWWITALPELICWYLGSAMIYTKKLWPDTEVVWGSLSGWLGVRQANKLRERARSGWGKQNMML